MLLYLLTLIISTALIIVGFLLTISGDIKKFKENFNKRTPKITELPIITPTGQIVNSVEDLDMQLEFLENQLDEKKKDLEGSKVKLETSCENLKRLTDMTNEVKKFYVKLKTEITRSEGECMELKNQIEDYKIRQNRLREEVDENVRYYTGMLNNIDGSVTPSEGYEIVKKSSPVRSAAPESFTIL